MFLEVAKNFQENGFVILNRFIQPELCWELKSFIRTRIDKMKKNQTPAYGNIGLIEDLKFYESPISKLFTENIISDIFASININDYKYWSGYLISKEFNAPATYWHQDWMFWNNNISYTNTPHHVNIMIYLENTGPLNGGLRIIPKSHRKVFDKHYAIGKGHDGEELNTPPTNFPELYSASEHEVSLNTLLGDIVVTNGKILHATHVNKSSKSRPLLILEFLTNYNELPETIKNTAKQRKAQKVPDSFLNRVGNDVFLNERIGEDFEIINRKLDVELFKKSIAHA